MGRKFVVILLANLVLYAGLFALLTRDHDRPCDTYMPIPFMYPPSCSLPDFWRHPWGAP